MEMKESYSWPYLSVLMFLLSGCAVPGANSSSAELPASGVHARAIIYFRQPASDNPKLSAAISDACRCQPAFFRSYPGEALIYEITLPSDYTFADFQKALLMQADELGIKSVEEERLIPVY